MPENNSSAAYDLVRSNSNCSNPIMSDFAAQATTTFEPSTDTLLENADDVFDELERWHEILRPYRHEMRGPRP
ncbi:hypothetical protein [Roseobacter sp.]|uniref:hypothetical protein n=1 Tax=Roseobacter sp. TaxID=1907202 RepID=UPI0029661B2F|nr:hypothetical protein [Roseobacter sp.]MDW3181650.1 hypothetical protein [Roseobacter sp.]